MIFIFPGSMLPQRAVLRRLSAIRKLVSHLVRENVRHVKSTGFPYRVGETNRLLHPARLAKSLLDFWKELERNLDHCRLILLVRCLGFGDCLLVGLIIVMLAISLARF